VPVNEGVPPAPVSLYGQTKVMAESILQRGCGDVSIRLGPLYGPGQPAAGFIPATLAHCARSREPLTVDRHLWSPLYLADAVRALGALIDDLPPLGGIYNLTSPTIHELTEVAVVCALACGWSSDHAAQAITSRDGPMSGYLMDPSRFMTDFDWQPRFALTAGIAECARNLRIERQSA
jgi:nucleoside-diphosphate-sugar epimerase